MMVLRILRSWRRTKSKITVLNFRRPNIGLFKDLLGRVQWDKALESSPSQQARNEANKLKHSKFYLNMRKNFFTLRVTALEHVAQTGCGVSFSGDIQDPPGQGSVQPTVGDPASAGGLDWMTHRGPFQPLTFCDSVIL